MQIHSYSGFWDRIHKAAKRKGFPLRVMFELTYRCNFFCKHCYIPFSYRKYKELKTKEIFSILDQLASIGCFYLGFTGGEPFIREDIMNILWYAKKKGFEIIIYTNGSLIDKKIADELEELVPNKVDITIPAISKESFERITGVPGSHKRVFNTIELLYKKGVNLGFKSCVLKENEREIEDIQKFAESQGALHRLDDTLSRCLDGSDEPFKYRGELKENLVTSHTSQVTSKIESEECDLKILKQSKVKTQNLFKCGVGISQAAITPLGELKMCLMIDYPKYKILNTSINECWQRLRALVGNIKPDGNYQCDKCELKAYCKWCPARSWLENRSFTSCTTKSRAKAEKMRELVQSVAYK